MVSKSSLRQNLLTSVFVLFVALLPYMACAIPFHLTLVSWQCCLLPYSLLSQIPSLVSSSLLPLVLCSCLWMTPFTTPRVSPCCWFLCGTCESVRACKPESPGSRLALCLCDLSAAQVHFLGEVHFSSGETVM